MARGGWAVMTDHQGAGHAKLLAELEVAMEFLKGRSLFFVDEQITRAGACLTLDRNGEFAAFRNFVRPQDEPRSDVDFLSGEQAADGQGAKLSSASRADGVVHGTMITSSRQALGAKVPDDMDDGVSKPLPGRLILDMTAFRISELCEAVGHSRDVELPLQPLHLVNNTFLTSSFVGSCLETSAHLVHMPR